MQLNTNFVTFGHI